MFLLPKYLHVFKCTVVPALIMHLSINACRMEVKHHDILESGTDAGD